MIYIYKCRKIIFSNDWSGREWRNLRTIRTIRTARTVSGKWLDRPQQIVIINLWDFLFHFLRCSIWEKIIIYWNIRNYTRTGKNQGLSDQDGPEIIKMCRTESFVDRTVRWSLDNFSSGSRDEWSCYWLWRSINETAVCNISRIRRGFTNR